MRGDALVGHTGFVGSNLARQRAFADRFNRANIADMRGRSYRRVVVSAAPATMWWANANPEADRANLQTLVEHLSGVDAEELVLVSTIAVFADAPAGDTEASGRFETGSAYGRNRRELEVQLAGLAKRCVVLRLPALFGPGLKKNFVFDLLNPVPSFIAPDRFAGLQAEPATAALLKRHYIFDAGLGMWSLDRPGLEASPDTAALTQALDRAGFTALAFTNSASRFQFYDVGRLADDIDRIVAAGLPLVNVCSAPLSAAEVAHALTGRVFENAAPPVVDQDMRSLHAGTLGGEPPYLYGRDATLSALKAFQVEAGHR